MPFRFSAFACLGLALLALGALAPSASGQDSLRSDTSRTAGAAWTDAQIRAAARVIVEMQKLRDRYQQQYGNPQELDSTESQAVRRAFKKEQQRLLKQSVADAPITAEQYRRILQRTRRDTTLRRRMRGIVLEVRKKQVKENRQRP